jgi:hypothetical protein
MFECSRTFELSIIDNSKERCDEASMGKGNQCVFVVQMSPLWERVRLGTKC